MTEAVFEWDGRAARPSACAVGPWDPSSQHGSAPAALLAWAAEREAADPPGRVARLTIDLMRPVPLTSLDVTTEVVRQGRKIRLSRIRLLADGVEVVRAKALTLRSADVPVPGQLGRQALDVPPAELAPFPDHAPSTPSPFLTGISMRVAKGVVGRVGAKAIWYRVDRSIIAGEPISPLMRAAITADFCNGTGAVLDPQHWTYIDADLTLNLTRMSSADWLLLDATTWLGPDGTGLAIGRLADAAGYFGRVTQSLLIEPRQQPTATPT